MTSEEMGKRLKIIKDIEDIKRLQYQYINILTFAKWDEVAECFTENGKLDLGEGSEKGRVIEGKAEITRVFKEGISKAHTGREGNYVVHPVIYVDNDEATGTWISYFMHIRSRGEEPLLHWMQGIYDCKYVKENGKWKFSLLKWRSRLKYGQSQMRYIE